MIEFLSQWTFVILRCSIAMLLIGLIVWGVTKILKTRSERIQQFAWMCVLVQAVVFVPFQLEVSTRSQFSRNEIATVPELITLPELTQLPSVVPSLLAQSVAAQPPPPVDLETWIMILWATVSAFLLIRMLKDYLIFISQIDPNHDVPEEWSRQLKKLCDRHRIRNQPALVCTHSLGPALCLTRRGYAILVPAELWNDLSLEQRQSVLLHELAHLQRRDLWRTLVFRVIATMHWFNPMAWYAVGRLNQCAENLCDDFVCEANEIQATHYARALLECSLGTTQVPSLVPLARGHSLVHRINRILNPYLMEESKMKKSAIVTAIALCAVAGGIQVKLVAQETTEATKAGKDLPTVRLIQDSTALRSEALQADAKADSAATTDGYILSLTTAIKDAQEKQNKRKTRADSKQNEAIVDVGYIFRNLPQFTKAMNELKAKVAREERNFNQQSIQLNELAKEIQQLSGDRAGLVKEKFAITQSSLNKKSVELRKEFTEAEARIYLEVFQSIRATIAEHAKKNGIVMVRQAKVRSQPKMELKNPRSIMTALQQEVLYVADSSIDITDDILKLVQKKLDKKETASKSDLIRN